MKPLLLLGSLMLLLTGLMDAQSPQFQNIIIIIQENRTPDDLFGAAGVPGIDAQINGGKAGRSPVKGNDFNHTHGGI